MKRLSSIRRSLGRFRDYLQLPPEAKAARREDRRGLPDQEIKPEPAIREALRWLGRAQDDSISQDGGVARHFSLIDGWGASYPETTGYIIPTMFECSRRFDDQDAHRRARRMLDWLVSIQLPEGAFQGGVIGFNPVVPVSFNTGQILLGLASGVRELGEEYRQALRSAADWLVRTQDRDGCWRRHASPFAGPGDKAYDTHVAWGLFEAARVEGDTRYVDAALANIRWALHQQHENGWFDNCCLDTPSRPLTHTLGYVLRGIVEAYRVTEAPDLLQASLKTADGLLTAIRLEDGFLPGRLFPEWRGAASWACLTGSVQIACCWFLLYDATGDVRYRDAAFAANRYVRRTMRIDGRPETRGAIKGAFPVFGYYGRYEYLNWAVKFFIDSHLLELSLRRREGTEGRESIAGAIQSPNKQ